MSELDLLIDCLKDATKERDELRCRTETGTSGSRSIEQTSLLGRPLVVSEVPVLSCLDQLLCRRRQYGSKH